MLSENRKMLFVSLFFSSVSDAKLSLTRSAPMWDKWEKTRKKEMRHTAGFQQYGAWLWLVYVVLNGETAGGYGVRFSFLALSTALSMALR